MNAYWFTVVRGVKASLELVMAPGYEQAVGLLFKRYDPFQ